MAKYLLVGAAALALAGGAIAQTMTEKSGNSTSTITQQGDGTTKREVTKTPDGQTITQETGSSKATVVQRNAPAGGECRETADKTADGKDAKTAENKTAENKPAESGKPGVDAKTEAADAGCAKQVSEPKDFGPGFERAQALKERMDAMRRQ